MAALSTQRRNLCRRPRSRRPLRLLLLFQAFHLAAAAPIMGWMSWERFRCETDCTKYPKDCIHEKLYYETADALVASGLAAAGYDQVSIDDCWTLFGNGRDPQNKNKLRADPKRFPGGIKKLADYVHGKGLKLGIYSDAGNATCGGYMGSRGFEDLDAQTFYEWGVDYLKLDGCYIDTPEEMEELYGKMGRALKKAYGNHVEGAEEVLVGEKKQEDDFGTGGEKTEDAELSMKRDLQPPAVTTRAPIKYSCSWPAYLGDDERVKPYDKMFANALCDTWRNWADIDNSFTSLKQIVNHWAVYTKTFESVPAQAINDPDMILAGDDHYGRVLSLDAAKLQLAVWSVVKAPLFLAADVRKFTEQEFFKPYVGVLTDETFLSVVKAGSDVIGGCVYGCGSLKGESTSQRLRLSLPFPSRKDNRVSKAPADVQIWSRRLGEKEIAVAFVNLNEKKAAKVSVRVDEWWIKSGLSEAWKTSSADGKSFEKTDEEDAVRVNVGNNKQRSLESLVGLDEPPPLIAASGSGVVAGSVTTPITWTIALAPMQGRLFVKSFGAKDAGGGLFDERSGAAAATAPANTEVYYE